MTQEEIKVQELLKPRYKVIADYPGSEFMINQIIHPKLENERHEFGSGLILMLSAFPHLFKCLSWWEERDASEMPEYVKEPNGDAHKISAWFWSDFYKVFYDSKDTSLWSNRCSPITESEYTAYIEKQPTTLNQGVC